MKFKYLIIIAITILIAIFMVLGFITEFGKKELSFGNKNKSVDEYTREAYAAMNDGNYAEAYMVVDIMSNTTPYDPLSGYDYSYEVAAIELNDKIVNNEIASLFENPGDPLIASKVSKILKERLPDAYSSSNDLERVKNCLRMAIDLAIECDRADLISKLIFQIPIRGDRREGLQDYYYGAGGWNEYYLSDCAEYNQICNESLDKALQSKNYEIAQEIINIYKEDSDVLKGAEPPKRINGVVVDGNHSYVKYNWKSKEVAQKKLNEAKKNR